MMNSADDDFEGLAEVGATIADRLEELSKPGLLEIIRAASPLFLDESEADAVRDLIDDIQNMSGLGQLKDPLQRYAEWCIRVDELFTKKRCRTENRAKKFMKIEKEFGRFLSGKIAPEVFVLRIREQIELMRSLARSPPKPKSRPKKAESKDVKKEKVLPEASKKEFLMRKFFQGAIIGIFTSVGVWFSTYDTVLVSIGTIGVMLGFFVGTGFLIAYYPAKKNTQLRRILAYLVLVGYPIMFLAISDFFLFELRSSFDIVLDLYLLLLLLFTELIVRWGPLKVLLKAADYVYAGVVVFAFLLIAMVVSTVIGDSFAAAVSVLAAAYTIWDKAREKDGRE
ncbi:MAG: hypothetical protein ACW99U_02950 [Candidatus Thorarchaeota archaeon]|jgi:hypothetical protein